MCFRVGSSYLTKPFTPQQLRKKIDQVWSARFDGSVSERQVRRVLKGGRELDAKDDAPLIVVGEAAHSAMSLRAGHRREVLRYLARISYVLSVVNAEHPDLGLGYSLQSSTGDFMKRLRHPRIGGRIKLALISTDMGGNSILLVRLLNINRPPGLTTMLVYNRIDEVKLNQRAGLEELEVEMLARSKVTAEKLAGVLDEYVVAPMEAPLEDDALTPEQIRERITKDMETMSTLPVLPQVYQRIADLAKDPDSELRDWAAAVEMDPLGSAAVLRRARSPSYGFRGDLQDVQRVVVLLGKETVKQVIVSEAVKSAFSDVEDSGFSLEEYWLHSVAVGLAAKILSFRLDEEALTAEQRRELEGWALGDEALSLLRRLKLYRTLAVDPAEQDPFVGGMVHDIGKVAMVNSYPGLFPLLLEELEQQEWKIPMIGAEDMVAGGLDHTMAGEILGQTWGFGDMLCRIIRSHHTPEPEDPFAMLIGIANFVGGVAFPVPGHACYPPSQIQSSKSLEGMEGFLPDNVHDAVHAEPTDLADLTGLLVEPLRQLARDLLH